MKSWKEVPHLFANGKFKIQYGDTEKYQTTFTPGWLEEIVEEPISDKYYTLIARKIEDMTDEECQNCPTYKPNDITPIEAFKYRLSFWVNYYPDELPAVVQNYLLSIGVFPFEWPEDGSVIDIKTLENR